MIRIGSKVLFAFTALTLAGSLCAGCAQAPQATEATSDAQEASTGQEATDATSSIPADAIAWEEASQHIGETVTIVGPVVSTDHDTRIPLASRSPSTTRTKTRSPKIPS